MYIVLILPNWRDKHNWELKRPTLFSAPIILSTLLSYQNILFPNPVHPVVLCKTYITRPYILQTAIRPLLIEPSIPISPNQVKQKPLNKLKVKSCMVAFGDRFFISGANTLTFSFSLSPPNRPIIQSGPTRQPVATPSASPKMSAQCGQQTTYLTRKLNASQHCCLFPLFPGLFRVFSLFFRVSHDFQQFAKTEKLYPKPTPNTPELYRKQEKHAVSPIYSDVPHFSIPALAQKPITRSKTITYRFP